MHPTTSRRRVGRRTMARLGMTVALVAGLGLAACSDDSGAAPDTDPATTATTIAGDPAPTEVTTSTTVADVPLTTVAPTTVAAAPIGDAVVTRSDDGAQLTVEWSGGSPDAEVRWGASPDAIDQPVDAPITGGSVTLDDPAPGGRAFFRIVDGDAGVTVAERRVMLAGNPNFRDLGGYETEDGRHVKWGQVYRSGALADLTDADLAVLDQIGLQLVCDLRTDAEVSDEPDPDGVAAQHVRIDILGADAENGDVTAEVIAAITAGDLSSISPDLLLDGMPEMAVQFTDQWSDLLRRISDPANRPTNFHCTAGKDRAGWAAALVLRALGVPEETVMADYLMSTDNLAADNAETIAQVRTLVAAAQGVPEEQVDTANLEALLVVAPEYLQAAFDAVDAEFGSFEGYLTDGLGFTDAELTALRDSLLE